MLPKMLSLLVRLSLQLPIQAMTLFTPVEVMHRIVVDDLASYVLIIEPRTGQSLQLILHPLGDRAASLRGFDAVLLGDLHEPSVRLLMVVYHAARKLANLLVLRLVGRQLPEPDLRTVHLCRVQQEDPILDMQLVRIGKSGAGRQPQNGERGGQAECAPVHARMPQHGAASPSSQPLYHGGSNTCCQT